MQLKALIVQEDGQDLAEYGLLVGFIVMVVLLGVTLFGQNLLGFWNQLAGRPMF